MYSKEVVGLHQSVESTSKPPRSAAPCYNRCIKTVMR